MGLGQESDREGEVVSWEAALSAPGRVVMNCRKVLFAAIAQNFGRQGLPIMTASMRLVHEGRGSGHITVGGADNDLRKALATARQGVHRRQSRALSVASRAGVGAREHSRWPVPSDCEGFTEVIVGATDREMSRSAALMHQAHRCSHNM